MQDFKGKVAVVTGAASGIGLALSKRFAAEGMKVVLADIEAQALASAVAQLPESAEPLGVVTDVGNAEAVDALAAKTIERFGAVHVLCNNAGVGTAGTTWGQTLKDWKWVLDVNLWGVIHGVRAFVPHLLKQSEGHVLNTASMAGLICAPQMGPYNVTKFGVVALSETLYYELQAQAPQIGVSVLCPGFVSTRIHESGRNRPAELRQPEAAPSAGQQARMAQAAALVAAGLPPEQVAEQVLSAIREQRFYVLTHPQMMPLVEQRVSNLLAGRNPQSPFGTR
jgi:NAD(P)-dependent dehydrogenase (short-subunit alcohol dehydrogenase family)